MKRPALWFVLGAALAAACGLRERSSGPTPPGTEGTPAPGEGSAAVADGEGRADPSPPTTDVYGCALWREVPGQTPECEVAEGGAVHLVARAPADVMVRVVVLREVDGALSLLDISAGDGNLRTAALPARDLLGAHPRATLRWLLPDGPLPTAETADQRAREIDREARARGWRRGEVIVTPHQPLGGDAGRCEQAAFDLSASPEALAACQRADEGAAQAGAAAQARIAHARGQLLYFAGEYRQAALAQGRARQHAERAHAVSLELATYRWEIQGLVMERRRAAAAGEPEGGRAALMDLVTTYERRATEVSHPLAVASALRKMAEGLAELGERAGARRAYEHAFALGMEHMDTPEELRALTGLVSTLLDLGETPLVDIYTQGLLERWGAAYPPPDLPADAPRPAFDLARLGQLQGTDLDTSQRLLEQWVIARSRRQSELRDEAEWAQILSVYQTLMQVVPERLSELLHESIALAALDRGELQRSAEALAALQALPLPDPAITRYTQIQLRMAEGQLTEVMALLDAADRQPEARGESYWGLRWLRVLALEKLGRSDEALALARSTAEEVERLAIQASADEGQSAFLGTPDRERLFRYVEQAHRNKGELEEALRWAERARVVFDVHQEAFSQLSAQRKLTRRLETYHAAVEEQHQAVIWDPRASVAEELRLGQQLAALRRQRQELMAELAQQAGLGEAPSPLPSLATGVGVLEFSAATEGTVVAYLLTARGLRVFTSPQPWRELDDLAAALAASPLRRMSHLQEPAALRLGQLFEQVRGQGIATLYVVPYASLEVLPLALVPVNGRPLIEGLDLAMVPSLKFVAADPAQREPAPPQRLRALVVGNPTRDLKSTEAEARQVAAQFGSSTLLLAGQASRQGILASLESAQVVHVAGHAVTPLGGAYGAHLLVAGRHLLTPWDLSVRRLSARLAVLSTCKSGQGHRLNSAERFGLPSALLANGVGAVLASLWPIEQGAALEPLTAFYARWDGSAPGVIAAWSAVQREATLNSARGEAGLFAGACAFSVWSSLPAGPAPTPVDSPEDRATRR